MSRPETKLWFYFLAASYIDLGMEAIHFGQTELMNGNDRKLDHYAEVLGLIRSYAKKHAAAAQVHGTCHVRPRSAVVHDLWLDCCRRPGAVDSNLERSELELLRRRLGWE